MILFGIKNSEYTFTTNNYGSLYPLLRKKNAVLNSKFRFRNGNFAEYGQSIYFACIADIWDGGEKQDTSDVMTRKAAGINLEILW